MRGWAGVMLWAAVAAAVVLGPAHAALPIGPGGGGAMFWPAVSPHDPKLMFVECDMSGIYRSVDGGRSWRMLDGRAIRVAEGPNTRMIFHPTDPNTLFAYAEAGGRTGLQVSHDRGMTWRSAVASPPWGDAAVNDLAIDAAAATHWIVAANSGMYVTQDAGRTWMKGTGVSGKAIDLFLDLSTPLDARRCFAATSNGVFVTEDGGATWTESDGGLPSKAVRHLAGGLDAGTRQSVVYVTVPSRAANGRFEGGVYRSTDHGRTWESAMGAGINTTLGRQDQYGAAEIADYPFLGVAADHPDTVYTTTAGTGYYPPYHYTVFRSDDAGRHWRYVFNGDPRYKEQNVDLGWVALDLGWGFGGPALGFAICPRHPDVALYSNAGELYLTTDGGKRWRGAYTARAPGQGAPKPGQRWGSVGLEVTTCWRTVPDPHRRGRWLTCYTDIGLMRSDDDGRTWRASSKGSPWSNTFYDLVFDPTVPDRAWAAASNQHDIPHWTQLEGATPNLGGGVVRSDDDGRSWRASSRGLPNAPVVSIALDPHSPAGRRRLWASVWSYGVYRSDDDGASWTRKSNGLGSPENMNSYRVELTRRGTLYCTVAGKRAPGTNRYVAPGGLWRSTDGGETWRSLTASLHPYWAMDFAIRPGDERTIYLCTAAARGEPGGLYKTLDGGESWRKLPVPPRNSYVEAFAPFLEPARPDTVYLTTGGWGTWVSRAAGERWSPVIEIPFMATHRIAFGPDGSRRFTTFGGGVWETVAQSPAGRKSGPMPIRRPPSSGPRSSARRPPRRPGSS